MLLGNDPVRILRGPKDRKGGGDGYVSVLERLGVNTSGAGALPSAEEMDADAKKRRERRRAKQAEFDRRVKAEIGDSIRRSGPFSGRGRSRAGKPSKPSNKSCACGERTGYGAPTSTRSLRIASGMRPWPSKITSSRKRMSYTAWNLRQTRRCGQALMAC